MPLKRKVLHECGLLGEVLKTTLRGLNNLKGDEINICNRSLRYAGYIGCLRGGTQPPWAWNEESYSCLCNLGPYVMPILSPKSPLSPFPGGA